MQISILTSVHYVSYYTVFDHGYVPAHKIHTCWQACMQTQTDADMHTNEDSCFDAFTPHHSNMLQSAQGCTKLNYSAARRFAFLCTHTLTVWSQ